MFYFLSSEEVIYHFLYHQWCKINKECIPGTHKPTTDRQIGRQASKQKGGETVRQTGRQPAIKYRQIIVSIEGNWRNVGYTCSKCVTNTNPILPETIFVFHFFLFFTLIRRLLVFCSWPWVHSMFQCGRVLTPTLLFCTGSSVKTAQFVWKVGEKNYSSELSALQALNGEDEKNVLLWREPLQPDHLSLKYAPASY